MKTQLIYSDNMFNEGNKSYSFIIPITFTEKELSFCSKTLNTILEGISAQFSPGSHLVTRFSMPQCQG